MKKKPVLYIDQTKFANWYLDEETTSHVISWLKDGRVISLSSLLQSVSYLPSDLILNPGNLLSADKNLSEIPDPSSVYRLILKDKKSFSK